MLWGFSPAQDLLEVVKRYGKKSLDGKESFNVLLLGCADPRHILQTLSKVHVHQEQVTINFYVADVLTDIVARHLLLLTVALEPSAQLSLFRKTQIWMETYANALVRPQTLEYVVQRAKSLIELVRDSDALSRRLNCVNLTDLKYKERDQLEIIFRFWARNDFDASRSWDARLRKTLGTRFDSKNGVFEWDFYMKMKERPGNGLICANEYNQWRRNGVAFVWLETEYSASNPTFAMGIQQAGDRLMELGYFGDMEIGPYYAFAASDDRVEVRPQPGGGTLQRATDVFEKKLRACLYEMERRETYEHADVGERDLGQAVLKLQELDVDPKPQIKSDDFKPTESYSSIPLEHKIHFLNTKFVDKLTQKSKFEEFFDVAVVAQSMEKLLSEPSRSKNLCSMIQNQGLVLWETRKAHFNLKECDLESYYTFVDRTMKENNFESRNTDASSGFFMHYQKSNS